MHSARIDTMQNPAFGLSRISGIIAGTGAVVAYFAVIAFSPFLMAGMDHHGADPGICPFMAGETALCKMDALGHLASLQMMTSAVPSAAATLLLLAVGFLLTLCIFHRLFDPPDSGPIPRSSPESRHALFRLLLLGSAISPRAP